MTAPAKAIPKISDLVRCRRERFGISQSELAKRAAVSVSTINELESGVRCDLRISTISKIADVLFMSVDEMLGRAQCGECRMVYAIAVSPINTTGEPVKARP
jgi:predicted transcriptional regulator